MQHFAAADGAPGQSDRFVLADKTG